MRLRAPLTLALVLGLAATLPALSHPTPDRRPGATNFDFEVQITRDGAGGFGPSLVTDRFGNLFATARKDTPGAVDDRAATATRARSWAWLSADKGKTWVNLPAAPVELDSKQPASGGDVAVDDAGNVYVADAYGADAALARYGATGLGKVALEATNPAIGTAGGDESPRLAAHGDGTVFYVAGASSMTGLAPRGGDGWGAGRQAVYVSRDGGATFDRAGYPLRDSDRCRPYAAPRSPRVYVTCTDGAGRLLAFVSGDDGRTFRRHEIGRYDVRDTTVTAPDLAVAPDGTVYAAHTDATEMGLRGLPNRSRIRLFSSRDGGATWRAQALDVEAQRYESAELDVSRTGKLAIAVYGKAAAQDDWHVLAATWRPGGRVVLVNFADHDAVAPHDAARAPTGGLGLSYGPDDQIGVTWTVNGAADLLHHVWYIRSVPPLRPSAPVPGSERLPVGPLPPCRVAGQVSSVGEWQSIKAPTFRSREGGRTGALHAYAVDPLDPAVVYATNGTTVLRSDDAACTWREVFSLESAPVEGTTLTARTGLVDAIVIPESRADHRKVYLQVAGDGGARPYVVRSDTGQRGTFRVASDGLPAAGRPSALRVNAQNSDFLWLAVTNGSRSTLWASEDGAQTWQSRTPATRVDGEPAITTIASDPFSPNHLWVVFDGVLRHSKDGGRTFAAPVAAPGAVTAVDVFHRSGSPARIAAYTADGSVVTSTDGGARFATAAAEGLDAPVESVAHGSRADVLVVGTGGEKPRVRFLHREHGHYDDITPQTSLAGPLRVSADRRAKPTFYAMSRTALLRYAGSRIEPGGPAGLPVGPSFADPARPPDAPRWAPPQQAVEVLVGDTVTLTHTVDLAGRPRQLDLFLLVDQSDSMKEEIGVVKSRLTAMLQRLRADGVDVRAGLGIYRTEEAPPRYARTRDVGPVDAELLGTLAGLSADGPGKETQLIALDQAITGAGADVCLPDACPSVPVASTCDLAPSTPGCDIEPGQQASFRPRALKVVLHVADAGFRNPQGTPRGSDGRPDLAGVAAKYRAAGVLNVGLIAGEEIRNDYVAGLEDLETMAAATGAVVPAGGLDCDGDGRVDRRAGQPFVCRAERAGAGVVAALEALTRTVADPARLAVSAQGATVVNPVAEVDLAAPSRQAVRVTYSCVDRAAGSYTATLSARVADSAAGVATTLVTCAAAAPPRVAPPDRGAPIVPPPLVPAPGAPAPAPPLTNPAPLPQTQVQLNPQTQVNPQAAAASQEQEQLQVATALNDRLGPQEDESLAMSGLGDRHSDEPVGAAVLLVGGALAAGCAGAVARSRTAPARVERDRS